MKHPCLSCQTKTKDHFMGRYFCKNHFPIIAQMIVSGSIKITNQEIKKFLNKYPFTNHA